MPSLQARIAKIEELLGAPGCMCGDRCHGQGIVLLIEFHAPATVAEVEEFERRAFWNCPAHGPCHAGLALRMRPSHRWNARPQRVALEWELVDP